MKQLKTILTLITVMVISVITNAQRNVQLPKELHGFWHFEAENPNNWNGTSIEAGYVEFFHKYYYVDEIQKIGTDGYQLKLFHTDGQTMELTLSELTDKRAKLKFSGWSEPKVCERLEKAVGTELIEMSELPSHLFKEWTNDNKGTLFCQFHKDGTVIYDGSQWNVLWAGWHMEKEYRLFINQGDLYQMLYIHKLDPQFMRLACDKGVMMLSPMAINKDIYKLLGNWAEKESNNWKLGFFEEFAIYNSDFWEYESFIIKGEKGKVVLKKGEEQLALKLQFKTDSICKISLNDAPAQYFLRCNKTLPAYSTKDTIAFKDTKFKYLDTVTIRGYLRSNPLDNPFSVGFTNPLNGEREKFYGDVDTLGRFTIRFPLYNTSQLYLDWGRMMKVDVAEPGESYFVFYNFNSKQHLIMGDNERLHNEMAGYDPYQIPFGTNEDYQKIKALPNMEYLEFQKDYLQECYKHLENHIENNPFVSERFKYYQRNDYRFGVAFNLMQRWYTLPNRNKAGRFPAGFMEYVNDTLYQNKPVLPITLIRDYLDFQRDYAIYFKDNGRREVHYCATSLMDKLIRDGKIILSKKDSLLFEKRELVTAQYNKLVNSKADSIQIKKAGIQLGKLYEELHLFEQTNKVQNEFRKHTEMEYIKIDLERWEQVLTDTLIRDLFAVKMFYREFKAKNTILSDDMLDIFYKRVSNPVLRQPILDLQKHYNQLNKQDICYIESIKNTDHLAEATDADSLFTSLIKPYRGKIIYLDIWGSWCGPCKDQMKYVGAVKEALKHKEVVFMYLANNSPEEVWKNIIKDNHLSGQNVVHYRLPNKQQRMLERRLSIQSFPSYILIDKEGNIENMDAPRPQQKEQLVEEISKLLIL